jgi:alpha-2-macroglobulin-like protein
MTTVDLGSMATPGSHEVALSFAGTGKLSYNVVAQHHVPWSMVAPAPGPLSIEIAYDKKQLAMDDIVKASVTVKNNTSSAQDMILMTLGLPPGFELLTEELERYRSERKLSMYETTGRQLILYVTQLPGSATQVFEYRLRATMPVRAADGGAEVALYYQPEKRASAEAVTLEVTAD